LSCAGASVLGAKREEDEAMGTEDEEEEERDSGKGRGGGAGHSSGQMKE